MRHNYFDVDKDKLEELLFFYTEKGYFEWFFLHCNKYSSYRKAYDDLEKEYFKWFKKNKYKNYEQFRVGKYRYVVKLLNRNN